MAKSKADPLPWAAHNLSEIVEVNSKKRLKCAMCGQVWSKSVTRKCPGLPVYGWDNAPKDLFTKTQLADKRLKPGEHVRGLLPYDKANDGYVRLYLESEATPMKARTDAQKAAVEKAQATRDKNLTCAKCKCIMPSKKYMRGDACDNCDAEEQLKDNQERDTAFARADAETWITREFVVFDFETTGIYNARPVSLCIIDQTGAVLLETLINPGIPIPPGATAIHGITDEMVASAPTFAEIYAKVFDLLDGKLWVAYNIAFNRGVVIDACAALDLPRPEALDTCDVMYLAAAIWSEWSEYWGNYKWVTLEAACWCAGVEVEAVAHSAAGDCLRTLGVLKAIATHTESEIPMPAKK